MSGFITHQRTLDGAPVTVKWAPQYADSGPDSAFPCSMLLRCRFEHASTTPEDVRAALDALAAKINPIFARTFKAINVGSIAWSDEDLHFFYAKKPLVWLVQWKLQ